MDLRRMTEKYRRDRMFGTLAAGPSLDDVCQFFNAHTEEGSLRGISGR
jgi:hypothetical protein